jgi:hypothetical protein
MFWTTGSRLKGWPVLLVTVLVLAFFLAPVSSEIAWATPPQQGTVPTPPKDEEEGGEPPGPTDLTSVEKVPWTVGPQGGKLDLKYGPAGCLLIHVLPGTLQEEILFEVVAKSAAQAPPDTCACNTTEAVGLCKTGTVYTVDGWYRQQGQPVGNEPLPGEYVHTICYTEADLALAGGDPNNLVIAFYDDASSNWQTIPSSVDTVNHNVSGLTNHLSWWALTAKKPCEPMTMPETGGTKAGGGDLRWSLGLGLLLILLGVAIMLYPLDARHRAQ